MLNAKDSIAKLKSAIIDSHSTHPIIPADEYDFGASFVQFNKESQEIILKCTTKNIINELITGILAEIQYIIGKQKLTPENCRFITIYFFTMVRCLKNITGYDNEELIEKSAINKIFLISGFFLKHGIPSSISRSYIRLAQAIGDNSNEVFEILKEQIRDLLLKKPTSKDLLSGLMLFGLFISTAKSLSRGIQVLYDLYDDFSKYRKEFCHITAKVIMQCFRISPDEFKESNIYIEPAAKMIDLFSTKRTIKSYRWESCIALTLLQQAHMPNGVFESIFQAIEKKLTNTPTCYDQDYDYALNAALYTALAIAETNGGLTYLTLFARFKASLCEIAKNRIQNIAEYYVNARYFIATDLPIALFITDQDEFEQVFLLFTSENTRIPRDLNCKVIERCSKFIDSEKKRNTIIKAITQTLEASSSDPEVTKNLHLLFNAFNREPTILEQVLNNNPGLATLMWKPCSRHGMLPLTKAFIKALDKRKRTAQDWQIIECTASAILESAQLYMALKGETLLLLGPILKFIIEVAKEILQKKDLNVSIPQITVFVMQMEGICLCLLPTPLSDVALKTLNDVVKTTEEQNVVEMSQIPVENYKKFLSICKKDKKFDFSDIEVFKPLQEIKNENTSVTKALSRHIATIAHALDPQAVNESFSNVENEIPHDLLRAEFTDSILLFGALSKKIMPSFNKLLKAMLQSSGFLGFNCSILLPKTLLPINYEIIGKSILERAKEVSVKLTEQDSQFTANSMKLMQLLISSPQWNTNVIYGKDIEDLALTFTSYINMLASPQRLFQCSEFLVAALTKYRSVMSINGRTEITRTLSAWLQRIEGGPSTEKAGASICNALALAIEGITFSLDNFDELNFITSSLDSRLAKQPCLHKEVANAIASIYKSNLSLFSRYELARTLIGSSFSRAAYTLAAERALINNTNTEATKKGFGIIDALFENNFSLIKEIATTIPVKIAETIGHDLALAALSRHVEMKLVEFMTDLEMKDSTDANKNMIFRGNAISSRTIMAFTKICGNQWAMSIYKPVAEYVQQAYRDGQSFNIKADRLLPGENLEKNRISYRIAFLKAIDVITTAIPRLPIQIIHMLQIVFNKVSAKFGDHGTMILNGILFLRFIIPTFTTTPTDCVGISEEARQGLVNLSVGLMAAALRGNLKEKGPDFEIFNDVAALALDRFSASSRHIISMDLKQAASKWIEVDERIVSESLTNSFAKFFNELTTRLNKETQGRKMTLAENTLLSTVYQVVDTPKTERPKRNVDDVYSSSGTMIKDYLSIPISAEEKEKLDSWLFNDTPELNDFDVLYLVTEKQPDVNPKLLIAHALRQMGEINDKFYFVADLSNFTQAQIPRLLILKKIFAFLPTTVKNNLQKIIIIRSSIDFVEYYTTNKQNIPFAEKISFAEDIDGISPIVVLSLKLPEENNEVLNHEGTPLLTAINDREALIRLGRTSLFYSFDINGVHANGALIYTKIKYLSALKALQNLDLEFTITDDAGNTLKFTTTPASSLYHLVVSAYSRVHIRPTKYPSIFTDSSDSVSTKWLLFLIGLICVQETDCEYLSGTGLSLLESTVKAYNFPIKVPSKPESAAKNARDIMNKAAEAFSQEAGPFIVEFEKVVSVIENPIPAFNLLPPWGIIIASGAGGYPAQRFIIELKPPGDECFKIVSSTIWKDICNAKYIKQMLKVFFPIATNEMEGLLNQFISANIKAVSEVAVSEILERRQNAIAITLKLLKDMNFDLKNYGCELLHATLIACGSTATNEKLAELADLTFSKLMPNVGKSQLFEAMIVKDISKIAKIVADNTQKNNSLRKELVALFEKDTESQFVEKAKVFISCLK